jgi:hypothetical protein
MANADDDEFDEVTRSFLESQRLNRMADYVSRGRRFGKAPTDAVEDGWRASMKAMSLAPMERVHWDLNYDYEAELELRGAKPPFGPAKEDVDRYLAATQRIVDELMSDPEERERIENDMAKDLELFRKDQDNAN